MAEQHINGGLRPIPDPSVLTTQQLMREIELLKELLQTDDNATRLLLESNDHAVRDILETRLNAMDKAIELLQQKADKVPSEVDLKTTSLKDLLFEKFSTVDALFRGIETQFEERDTRVKESAVATSTAVAAALQAAKEAVGEQNKSFTLSIDKSEAATTKQIDAITTNHQTEIRALYALIGELQKRLDRQEGQGSGIASSWMVALGIIGILLPVTGIILALILRQ